MQLDCKKSKLKNGARVITIPLGRTEAITALVLVGTGSHYEPKPINGISHFLEHLFFKGSKKYTSADKISTTLDSLGASFNAFTTYEMTGYYVKVVKDNIDMALDVMSDFLKNPLFDKAEIERERGVIMEEMRMYQDIPQQNVVNLLMQALYDDQPAGRNIVGTKETILKVGRKDFQDYFERQYRGDNIVLVIAGNISHASARKLADKFFGGLPHGNSYDKQPVLTPSRQAPYIALQTRRTDQTHFLLGFPAYNIFDKRQYAASVLATVLGGGMSSRLFTEVRGKRGLAYYVGASFDVGTDCGVLTIKAGVTNNKTEEALRATVTELKRIKKEAVGVRELNKAKKQIEGRVFLYLETSDDIASFYGDEELLRGEIETPQEYIKKIMRVTIGDIQSVANDVFFNKRATLALIGPHKNASLFQNILAKL